MICLLLKEQRIDRNIAKMYDKKPNVLVSRMYNKQLLTKIGAIQIKKMNKILMNNDLSNTQNLTKSLNPIVVWYKSLVSVVISIDYQNESSYSLKMIFNLNS